MSENKKDEVVKDIETVTIGDVVYNKDEVTPSAYFEYVKGLKEKLNNEEYNLIIDTTIKMLKKAELTKQTEMAYKLTEELKLALRELDAAKAGFDIYVSRKEVEKYITAVEAKSIKIIELSKYEREIPDDVIDKISKANEIFDELYIVFTDYTKKETKNSIPQVIAAGIGAEIVMVLGYFVFEIFMLSIVNGTDLKAGLIASAAGIVPNIVQGVAGVIISSLLHPVLHRLVKRQ